MNNFTNSVHFELKWHPACILIVNNMGAPANLSTSDNPETAGLVRANGVNGSHAANGANEDAVFEASVIEFFVESAELLGVPKSLATIYGTCFASAEPLSFSDIQHRIGLSAGSISQGLKVLREVGALKVVHHEADRREFFQPDLELRKLADRWIAERLQRQLTAGNQRLKAMGKNVPSGRPASAKILRQRIKHVQNWHDKASSVLPILRGLLKLG